MEWNNSEMIDDDDDVRLINRAIYSVVVEAQCNKKDVLLGVIFFPG